MNNNKQNIITISNLIFLLLGVVGLYFGSQVIYLKYFAEDDTGLAYSDMAARTNTGKRNVYPRRGAILSSDGTPLAVSVPSYTISIDYLAGGLKVDTFHKYVDPLSKSLAKHFKDKSAAQYKAALLKEYKSAKKAEPKLLERFRMASYNKRILKNEIDIFELELIKKFPLFASRAPSRSGFVAQENNRREYLYDDMAYRTIGYVGRGGTSVGIEAYYDEHLVGKKAQKTYQVTAKGDTIWSDETNGTTRDGLDLQSTLDVEIQDIAEMALRRSIDRSGGLFVYGTAVVMDVETGDIKAMVNLKKQNNGSFKESMNYAISEGTDPGSTFKIASLIAALETGRITIEDKIDCGSVNKWTDPKSKFTFTEAGRNGYGTLTVQQILEKSSNVGVAKMIRKVFDNKEEQFTASLHKMHLGQKTGIDLLGEAHPIIKHAKGKNNWNRSSMQQMSIGYEMQLAPIQTLTLYNAIANGGKMMKPRVVKALANEEGEMIALKPEVLERSICSDKTLKQIRKVLSGVITSGTAQALAGTPFGIAGKTGTAQIAFPNKRGRMVYHEDGMKRHQASFCGYFPERNPKYSCIVVLYTGKISAGKDYFGGTWAAPVFKEIANKVYAISPYWTNPIQTTTPAFASMKVTDRKDAQLIADYMEMKHGITKLDKQIAWCGMTVDDNKQQIDIRVVDAKQIPSALNMGLRDAIYLLESRGFKVQHSGRGRVVAQTPHTGDDYKWGQTIKIELASE